jgi:hypothetical protein
MNSKTLLLIIIILVVLGLLAYLYKTGKLFNGPVEAKYEQKVRLVQGREIIYPEFNLVFTGETTAPDTLGTHPVYNFKISSENNKTTIAIDMNVGFAGSTQVKDFNFEDKQFYIVADSTTQEIFVNIK